MPLKNHVHIEGQLTNAPYHGNKGYFAGNIAVGDSSYKPWLPYYIPAEVSGPFEGAQKNETWEMIGKIGSNKDKDGKQQIQLIVSSVRRLAVNTKGEVKRPGNSNTQLEDEDFDAIPF